MGFWSKGCYHSQYERNIAYPERSYSCYAKHSSYKVDDIYNEVIDSRFQEEMNQRKGPEPATWPRRAAGSRSQSLDYPFSVFKMKRSSSHEDMKKAYRRLLLETHPDKTDYDSDEEFIEVQEAWENYQVIACDGQRA